MNADHSVTFSVLVNTVAESVLTARITVADRVLTVEGVDYNGLCIYRFVCEYNGPNAARVVGMDRLLEVVKHRGELGFAKDLSTATVDGTTIDLPAIAPECHSVPGVSEPVVNFSFTLPELKSLTLDLMAGGEFLVVHVGAEHTYFTSIFECGVIQYEVPKVAEAAFTGTAVYAVKFLKFIHVAAGADAKLFIDAAGALNFVNGALSARLLPHPLEDVGYDLELARSSLRERINTVDRQISTDFHKTHSADRPGQRSAA